MQINIIDDTVTKGVGQSSTTITQSGNYDIWIIFIVNFSIYFVNTPYSAFYWTFGQLLATKEVGVGIA